MILVARILLGTPCRPGGPRRGDALACGPSRSQGGGAVQTRRPLRRGKRPAGPRRGAGGRPGSRPPARLLRQHPRHDLLARGHPGRALPRHRVRSPRPRLFRAPGPRSGRHRGTGCASLGRRARPRGRAAHRDGPELWRCGRVGLGGPPLRRALGPRAGGGPLEPLEHGVGALLPCPLRSLGTATSWCPPSRHGCPTRR